MSLVATKRDRVLLAVLAVLALAAGYWLLLLKPTLEESRGLEGPIAEQETRLASANARRSELVRARGAYRREFRALRAVYRAVPTELAISSLLRELEDSARGSEIELDDVVPASAEGAEGGTAPAAGGTGAAPADAGGAAPADAGGTAPADGGAAAPTDAGAAAPADAAGTDGSGADAGAAAGLQAVPIQFSFSGDFFGLTEMLDRLQGAVGTRGGRVQASGRLVAVTGWSFDAGSFPRITADVDAVVYLAPGADPVIAQATPAGPPGAQVDEGRLQALGSFVAMQLAAVTRR